LILNLSQTQLVVPS